MESNPEIVGYYLYVQDARPLSNYIAEKYNVVHQSPQVFLIREGKVVWNTSHDFITEEELTAQVIK